jgi:methanogenic corrinoid protein MtbC1
MHQLLQRIAYCVEEGKINAASPFPPSMKGQQGVDELTREALSAGVNPQDILNQALMVGMQKIGVKFRENKVFVPNVLMAAKAMGTAMVQLKPHFLSGAVTRKGTVILGTVSGDLHDIGKNLVAMMIEGGGYEIVDLGVDVSNERFIEAVASHPGCVVGMSALLTTTMANMHSAVTALKERFPQTRIIVGGAPLSQPFCDKIGADCYCADPQGAVEYLDSIAA